MSTTYFPVFYLIFLVGFKGSNCKDLNVDVSFRQPFTNNSNVPILPMCNSNGNGIFSNVPSVSLFTNTLNQAIQKSPILRKVFDLSQTTAKQYSQYLYEFNFDLYKCYGMDIAHSIAEFVSRAVGLYFDKLTMPVVMNTLSGTAANFLLVEGILNTHNAKNLAMAYSKNIEQHANGEMTADPTSKFQVLADSFFNYMASVDRNLKMTAPISTYFYGIGWFMSAVDFGCFNP